MFEERSKEVKRDLKRVMMLEPIGLVAFTRCCSSPVALFFQEDIPVRTVVLKRVADEMSGSELPEPTRVTESHPETSATEGVP